MPIISSSQLIGLIVVESPCPAKRCCEKEMVKEIIAGTTIISLGKEVVFINNSLFNFKKFIKVCYINNLKRNCKVPQIRPA
jgi:hypothetical protein